MKKYINKIFAICTLLFLGASCENDAVLTTLKTVNFSGPIEASSSTIVLSSENNNLSVVTISWPEVIFPINAPVTYALEFDLPADAVGATAWSKAIHVEAGVDVLSKAFSGSDLNKMAIKLGLPVDEAGKIVVRIASTLNRTIYSEAIELTVTPFEKAVVFGEIYMPGSYQGWNIETAASLSAINIGVYQGYVTIPAGSGLGFKLNTNRNWDQFFGAGATNDVLVDHSDTDFIMPEVGSFQINVNLNTAIWKATPYSWGIIGDATPGSWDNSTSMSFNHELKQWEITSDLIVGNLKFRLNNAWTINYGSRNNDDGIVYLDDPGAHYISEAGTYKITYKIDDTDPVTNGYPPTATYTITKI
jgi:hypothetical protein